MPIIADALKAIKETRFDRAEELFTELEKDQAKRSEVLAHRAWMYRALGRYEEARRDYEALVSIPSDDLLVHALHADAVRLCGEVDEAARLAVGILAKDPFQALACTVVRSCQDAKGVTTPLPPIEPGPENVPPHIPWNKGIAAIESSPDSYPTSSYPEVGRFLYGFVRALRPSIIVETGTFIALSSLCMAQGLEENGFGHLHSFDLFMNRPGWVSPVIGRCDDALQVARAHIEHGGLSHRVTFHKGDSSSTIREAFAGKTDCVDLAFIDGDHTIKGALRDWEAIHPLIKEGGFILLHDTVPEKCNWMGPEYLMVELGKRWPKAYRWVNVPTPEGFGIGIIQKIAHVDAKAWRPPLMELFFEELHRKRMDRKMQKET
ncbi:class I SAM-dependent methyltransferase [bacterium]|nr:class I SAM-dependent methyltransferase [bacterium]